jgi:hypothetical protein
VAVHFLVTLYDPAQAPELLTSSDVSVKVDPHASVADATANAGVAGQLMVVGAGSVAMTGAVISLTLIVWDAVDELPQPSVAVHVLFTLYDPAHAPEVVTSLNTSDMLLLHASVATACVKDGVAGQSIVVGAGSAAMTGAVMSCTLIT